MRSSPRAALLALGVALAVVGIAVPLLQTLIPRRVDGTVTRVDVRYEKHPGSDDIYVVTIGGHRPLVVHREVGRRLVEGEHVEKERFSRTLRQGDRTLRLGIPAETRGVLTVTALTLALAAILLSDNRFGLAVRRRPRLVRERERVGADELEGPEG